MRRFLKPFFSRIIPGAVLLILQMALLVMPVAGLFDTALYMDVIIAVLSVIIILFEINRDTDSGYKLIWIAIIAIFPVFGVFLYIYVQSDVIIRYIRKKFGILSTKINRISEGMGVIDKLKDEYPDEYGIFNYMSSKAYAPCFSCGDIKYFSLGDDMYTSLMNDINSADKYIFLEYFIINEKDFMWKNLYSALCEKAKNGVEVRLIYDALGSLTCTGADFEQRLNKDGIMCHAFSPVKPFVSTYHNNRNHRKIAVIDGKCAYTGGINIADEYINRKERFGHWKDSAVRVEGDGVKGFVLMYTRMWNLVSRENLEFSKYIDTINDEHQNGYICAFDDTPMDTELVTRNVYLHIINTAKKNVYINTPYLILDDALLGSLKYAAARGVDVRICMPHIPDKWYAFAVGRSYYPELIRHGVRIYEYTPGFLHAKSTVSDGCRAYVGSANYDYRSLYLHYECGAYMYGNNAACELERDFLLTLEMSEEITEQKYKSLGLLYRLTGRILRFFAALM